MKLSLALVALMLLTPHTLPAWGAPAKTIVAVVNLRIALLGDMEEIDETEGETDEKTENKGTPLRSALFVDPERNLVFRVEEKDKPFGATLRFVSDIYAPAAGLQLVGSEDLTIAGKRASLILSDVAPDSGMRQSILVLGDDSRCLFAYAAYQSDDSEAPADVRDMFMSMEWPVKK